MGSLVWVNPDLTAETHTHTHTHSYKYEHTIEMKGLLEMIIRTEQQPLGLVDLLEGVGLESIVASLSGNFLISQAGR